MGVRCCRFVVLFFSALSAASTISLEKDRRTFILLLLTDLRNYEIVLGKLFGSPSAPISKTSTLAPSWLATSIHLPLGSMLKFRGVLIPSEAWRISPSGQRTSSPNGG